MDPSPESTIQETLKRIHPPSAPTDAVTSALPVARPGSGELGRLGERLGRVYKGREVRSPLRKLLLIAAADHGLASADHGLASAGAGVAPADTTASLLTSLLARRPGVSRLAARSGARALVADFGVTGEVEVPAEPWAEFVSVKVAPGGEGPEATADLTERAAMSRQAALASLRAGVDALKGACSKGELDLVGTAGLGVGGETAACTIAAVLTGRPVAELTGVGRSRLSGHDSKRDKALAARVQRALDRPSPDPLDAVGVLSEYGGLEIGALTGVCLAAAERGLPVVLGGLVSGAAAALAADLAPAVKCYLVASDRGSLPAQGALLEYLGLAPLMSLGLDSGEGAGATLGMELADAAWELVSSAP